MAAEPHKRIKLVHFHVVDASIDTVYTFEYQLDTLQLSVTWGTLEDFTLNDCEITTLNSKHKRVVQDEVVDGLDSHEDLLSFSGSQRTPSVQSQGLVICIDGYKSI